MKAIETAAMKEKIIKQTKPTPIKYCVYCGKKLERLREKDGGLMSLFHFGRRKYCDFKCMSADRKGIWRVKNPKIGAKHLRARIIIDGLGRKGTCSICGKRKKTEVHHKDLDDSNNKINNLQEICSSCHHKIHMTPERRKKIGDGVRRHYANAKKIY